MHEDSCREAPQRPPLKDLCDDQPAPALGKNDPGVSDYGTLQLPVYGIVPLTRRINRTGMPAILRAGIRKLQGFLSSLAPQLLGGHHQIRPRVGFRQAQAEMISRLSDVRSFGSGRRRPSFPVGMAFEAKSKLVFQWCGVPIALASLAAISLMGVLSFGLYGAAMTLGRIRPLRNAYQSVSGAYDRFLGRLGQEVLEDPRDTPALRLMVSISLSAIPIFLIQLVL